MLKSTKVILDTNVFVSGLLSPVGIPGLILFRFRKRDFQIYTSQAQITEIREVLKRPSLQRALPKGTTKEVLRFFMEFKKLTKILNPHPMKWDFPDPDDHFLLDLTVASRANFLVTGDKKLQSLLFVETCSIVSPVEFIARLK